MGRRGPAKGAKNAGRPPESGSGSRKKTAKPKPSDPVVRQWSESLSGMTFEQIAELAGKWRPVLEQDRFTVAALAIAAKFYAKISDKLSSLDIDDWCQITDTGYESSRVIVQEYHKLFNELLKASKLFGLSPGDRARMGEQEAEDTDDDPFAEYVKAGAELLARKDSSDNEPPQKRAGTKNRRAVHRPSPKPKTTSGKARKASTRKAPARPEGSPPKKP